MDCKSGRISSIVTPIFIQRAQMEPTDVPHQWFTCLKAFCVYNVSSNSNIVIPYAPPPDITTLSRLSDE